MSRKNAPTLLERYTALARVRSRRVRRKGRDFLAGAALLRGAQPHPARSDALSLADTSGTSSTPDNRLAIDTGSASVGFVISSRARDRQGDVVVPTGCLPHLAYYEVNPQVFFAHRSTDYPIARAKKHRDDPLSLWVEEARILSRAFFHLKTEESSDVFGLIVEDVLNATSIGFLPVRGRLITGDFDEDAVEDGDDFSFDTGGITFLEWQLLEWSVVPVPANPEAIRSRLASSRKLSPLVRKSLEPFAQNPKSLVRSGYMPPSVLSPRRKSNDPAAPPSQPGQAPGSNEPDEHDVQCVEFDPHLYRDEPACQEWLKENGLEGAKVLPRSSEDEPLLAEVFPASECAPESHEVKEVEQGVKLHTCKRVGGEDEEEKRPQDKDDEYGPDGGGGDMSASTSAPASGSKGGRPIDSEPGPGAGSPALDAPGEPDGDEPGHQEPDGDEPQETLRPYGAEVLDCVLHHFRDVCEYLAEAVQVLEHPQVLKYCQRLEGVFDKLTADAEAFAKKTYPDHFGDESDDPGAGHDEPDADDMPEDKDDEPDDGSYQMSLPSKGLDRVRSKGLTKGQESVITDAADCYEELSSAENLQRTQKAACKMHCEALRGLAKAPAPSPASQPDPQGNPADEQARAAEEAALARFLDSLETKWNTLAERWYEQTGETL